jgi:hypothetical protein
MAMRITPSPLAEPTAYRLAPRLERPFLIAQGVGAPHAAR